MSLFESMDSTGTVSLRELFEGKQQIEGMSRLSIEEIAFLTCRGGWPATVGQEKETALQMATNYVEAVINMDVQRVDEIDKSPDRVRMLLRSLARNIATTASIQTIKPTLKLTKPASPTKQFHPISMLYVEFLWLKIYRHGNRQSAPKRLFAHHLNDILLIRLLPRLLCVPIPIAFCTILKHSAFSLKLFAPVI